MWHLKTRLGTFWVIEKAPNLFYLGIDVQSGQGGLHELGSFGTFEEAVAQVNAQETGFYEWDALSRIKPPAADQWSNGAPSNWDA